MSAEDTKVDPPVEVPAEETPATEATTVEEAAPAPAAEAISPEAAILSPDVQVVTDNLEKAEPVENPGEATTSDAAPTSEETPAEAAPATPEKKEGSSLLSFIKKNIPNPKLTPKKGKAVETPAKPEGETAATEVAAPAAVEPVEEGPLDSYQIEFKTHGGFFGGGWKTRTLQFGKEDGYSKETLYPYIGIHKAQSLYGSSDKAAIAWGNAAHATVTGVGLLFVVKSKALDIPLNIINLADVTDVVAYGSNFTVKTSKSGDYDFGAGTVARAKSWKAEIEKRAEQSKLTHKGVVESEEYKSAYSHYEGQKGRPTKTPEAVTSDEEGALSGEEKKPGKWSRRISGGFGRLTSPTKEKENPAEAVVVAPAVAEVATDEETQAVAETAPVIPETVVTEPPTDTAADSTPAESKKEKRKSFTGFGTLFKNKSVKEPSPEPTTEETSEVPTEAVVESTVIAPLEPVNPTEDPAAAPTETPKTDKTSKRTSIFGSLLTKKDKSPPTTNGESTEPATTTEDPVPSTSEPIVPPTEETPVADPEVSPVTPKKEGLGRRLTSQFKSLGRAKSPDKGKTAKVSDEAPKIDTAIESTPEAAPTVTDPTPAEPLSTTEAPPAPVDSTLEQPTQPAVVSTLA